MNSATAQPVWRDLPASINCEAGEGLNTMWAVEYSGCGRPPPAKVLRAVQLLGVAFCTIYQLLLVCFWLKQCSKKRLFHLLSKVYRLGWVALASSTQQVWRCLAEAASRRNWPNGYNSSILRLKPLPFRKPLFSGGMEARSSFISSIGSSLPFQCIGVCWSFRRSTGLQLFRLGRPRFLTQFVNATVQHAKLQ